MIVIEVNWLEVKLRNQLKGAGGRWNPERQVRELRFATVSKLSLQHRIVKETAYRFSYKMVFISS
jgi:hypothetical protein